MASTKQAESSSNAPAPDLFADTKNGRRTQLSCGVCRHRTQRFFSIIVVEKQLLFVAHRTQLQKSPYFTAALKKKWLEGQTNCITLPCDDPEDIRHYLHFLYTNTIFRHPQQDQAEYYDSLASMYVHDEKLVDLKYKNAILSMILKVVNEIDDEGTQVFPTAEAISIVYGGTLPGSIGRKLMIDLYYQYGDPSWFANQSFPGEFMSDLVMKRMSINAGDVVDEGRAFEDEDYHEVALKKKNTK